MTSIETFVVAPIGATNLAPPGIITAKNIIVHKTTILLVAELRSSLFRKLHPVTIYALDDSGIIPDNVTYIGSITVGFEIKHFYIGEQQ